LGLWWGEVGCVWGGWGGWVGGLHIEGSDIVLQGLVLSVQLLAAGRGVALPLDVVLRFLLYQPDTFQHIGDVVYPTLLHLQKCEKNEWLPTLSNF